MCRLNKSNKNLFILIVIKQSNSYSSKIVTEDYIKIIYTNKKYT